VTSFEDVAYSPNDDPSSSLCYLDDEEDDESNCGVHADDKNKNNSSSKSICSEVFADDDSENDNQISLESSGAVLVDECYDIILNNNSMNTAIGIEIYGSEEDDDSDSDKAFRTDDPMLNRSLPIIESRGLRDLFFDDYENDEELVKRCHRSVVSTASGTGTSSRHRRPYTICDF
jgi:hypothetical protein